MNKTIKIGENEITMKSSAYTLLSYKEQTGRELIDDIGKMQNEVQEDGEVNYQGFSKIIGCALDMAYVMALEYDGSIGSKADWLKGIESMEGTWVNDVLALAMSIFQGRVPQNEQGS